MKYQKKEKQITRREDIKQMKHKQLKGKKRG
jgi:hypothetical protein